MGGKLNGFLSERFSPVDLEKSVKLAVNLILSWSFWMNLTTAVDRLLPSLSFSISKVTGPGSALAK